ncbi:MAG: terpene cyclase/mutase family protein [Planctomycetes bacterium]|nr:terpene cyclase/mutase family protein [Planctomycetota bacterium]
MAHHNSDRMVASLPLRPDFHDALAEWMERAPWLALSAAAHVVLALVLMAIPWEQLRSESERVFVAEVLAPEPEVFDDPPLEEPPELPEVTELVEPQLVDANDPTEPTDVADVSDERPLGELDAHSDATFEAPSFNPVIGVGGGAGSKFGSRFGDGRGKRGGGGVGTEQSLRDALAWLRAHQAPDGSWDADGFAAQCGRLGATRCADPGEGAHDVGVTALALLAFLGDGHTTLGGVHRDVVARGVRWLREQQDPDSGLVGAAVGHAFLYDHAIATLALCEAYYFSRSPSLKRPAQEAANYLSRARNRYGVWRYDVPPSGQNDTSVTGWCLFALQSARESGLAVDDEAFVATRNWLDEVTDPRTGRCGYDSIGGLSSRVPRVNDVFPPEKGEAMTAVALLCRFFLGEDPAHSSAMRKHAELLRAKPPRWDPSDRSIDVYYWYYGTYAMYQMGGSKDWEQWNRAMKSAVVDSQRKDGDERGSWDAAPDAWGHSGGRVYTTAMMSLCLEVYFRYSRVLGAR